MKDIKKPEFMLEAMRGRRGFIAVLEMLIAIVVFVVSSIAMSIGTIPLMIGYFVSDPEFMKTAQAVADGSMDSLQYMQKMQDYALHLPDWMTIATLLLEILMIAVVFIYCRFLEKRKIRTLGFRKKGMLPQYLKGAVAGALFFSVAYLICVLTGSIHVEGLVTNMAPLGILGYFVGYLVQGMAEEVLCRGYLFVSLSRRHSVVYSAVLSALFFAMLHGANSGLTPLAVFNLFLFGIFAALLLVKCENIWVVGAFHSLWNFAQGNIYGIQVSGNSLQPAILNSSNVKGHGLINGAGFGLEGGLGVTLVLGLGIVYLVYNLNKQGKIVEWEGFRPVGENYNNDMPSGQNYAGPQYNGNQQDYAGSQYNGNEQSYAGSQYNGNEQSYAGPQYGREEQDNAGSQYNGNEQSYNGSSYNSDQEAFARPQEEAQFGKSAEGYENMGVAPGQTPWHPETPEQKMSDEKTFNADYFKE